MTTTRRPIPPKKHPYNQWSPDARALDLVGDKWTLLIIRDLMSGPRRFVNLQHTLPGISTEQLRSRLNRMVADGLLNRQRFNEVPPRVDYELTHRGRALAPVLAALAQWGHEFEWSRPEPGERVDVTAIFRLAPALLRPLVFFEKHEVVLAIDGDATYTVVFGPEGVEISEARSDDADATVSGSQAEWAAALGPRCETNRLKIDGRVGPAVEVLHALQPAAGAAAPLAAAA